MQRRKLFRLERREAILGYVYISPWLVGFVVFMLGPMLYALFLSFHEYTIVSPPRYCGLDQYVLAFNDRLFWKAVRNTVYYAALVVPSSVIGSLLCAMLLNQKLIGRVLFRTLFYLPSIVPIVASTLVWVWVLNPDVGILNYWLSRIGVQGPPWLLGTKWAKPAIILISLWASVGGSQMIIFLAGLQGIPRELYEAALIDGANAWQRFWSVTLPMLSPTIFLNLVLALISSLRVFASAYVATQGGPARATYFYVLHMFFNGFQFLRMGHASALAWIFIVVVAGLTIVQFRVGGRWVYYAGERQ
jgi:multiple sugar transport system permease protein